MKLQEYAVVATWPEHEQITPENEERCRRMLLNALATKGVMSADVQFSWQGRDLTATGVKPAPDDDTEPAG